MNKQLEDIRAIREMMERSSKFLSLSGLSGGVIAITGAALAYFHILKEPASNGFETTHEAMFREITLLITDASAVLLFSICFGIYFSWKKSVKNSKFHMNVLRLHFWLKSRTGRCGMRSVFWIRRWPPARTV